MKTNKTKNESVNIEEAKKDSCCCGDKCQCGDDCGCCNCHCGSEKTGHTLFNAGVTLLSALIIAGAVMYSSGHAPKMRPLPREVGRPVGDAVIAKFIKNNPAVIIESLDKYYTEQEKKAKAAQKPTAAGDVKSIVDEIVADKSNFSIGNPKGEFVIIEFFDYNCGWCKRTNDQMWNAVHSAEGKNIRWIPIDTPIFGAGSELISRYVLAAGMQGKYAEMHHAVAQAKSKKEDDLIKLGEGLKLDTAKLKADANSDKLKNKIKANQEYTRALGVGGVPMLIVNGKIHQGALLDDNLKAVVAESNKK